MSGRPNTQTRDITELKNVQQKSLQSELAIDIIEAMVDGVVIVGMDGKVTFINKAFEKMLGYNRNEIVGIPAAGLPTYRNSKDKKRARQALKMVIEKGSAEPVDMIALTKDERGIPISFTASVIKDAQGDPRTLIAVIRDITERKQAEEALRRSEEYFRALMDNSLDAVTVMSEDGTIRYESPSYERLLGFKPEERVGSNLFERIHPDDTAKVAELFAGFLQNRGGTIRTEVRAQHKDGPWHCIEAIGSNLLDNPVVKGIVVNLRDITERKEAEEALIESEQWFRAIFDNAVDGIVLADLDNRKLYTCNKMFSQMLGYSVGEIKKLGVMDIHPEKDLSYVVKKFERQAAKEITLANDIPVTRKDGSIFYADVNSSLITVSGKSYMMGIYRDITERKKAEEVLRRSEEKLKLYLDSSPDAIYISDTKGIFLYGNRAAEKLTGYLREELVGKSFLELSLLPQEYLLKAARLHELNMAGKPTGPDEFELIKRDGSRVFVDISTYPVGEGDNLEVIGIARDITERKKAEEEVRRLSDAVRMTTDSVAITDMGGRIMDINEAGLRMYGLGDRADFVGKNPLDAIAPEDRRKALENMAKIMETGQVNNIEYHVLRKDGSGILIETSVSVIKGGNGEPQGLVAVARDITERKQTEEALRLSEERYRLLVDNASEAILVIQDGMFKFFNDRAVELLGYSREELASKPFIELIHSDDQRMLMERYLERLKGGNPPSLYSFRVINKAGNLIWGEVNAVAITWEGRPATLNFLTDVTERKNAEEEKQRMEEKLRLAGRLAAVGELAAGVAHELNNPLAIIQMYSEFSKERGDLDDTAKKDLQIIYEQTIRASEITHNLLSFARKHEPGKNMVSVNEIIKKTLEMHSHQMSINNIELSEELQPALPMIMADDNQMQQVFMNIIINAEQAMLEAHGRGKLRIKTETTEGTIKISFTDDGPGIPEGNLKRIFDPFFTTKVVGKGTGLGLSICYGIVQAHGGHIYVLSTMGEGATFVIEIPITSEYQEVSGIENLSHVTGG